MTTSKVRRTQDERTAEAREALFQATVKVIDRVGYGGASTALIAKEAGASRGLILHHFGTRAQLMAETVSWVYDQEQRQYAKLSLGETRRSRVDDWPDRLWAVLSQPAGIAVLEILQATRSDMELAEKVLPMQRVLEDRSRRAFEAFAGWKLSADDPLMRLLLWSIRGLSIAKGIVPDPASLDDSVHLLKRLLMRAIPSGSPEELNEDDG